MLWRDLTNDQTQAAQDWSVRLSVEMSMLNPLSLDPGVLGECSFELS